MRALAVIQPMPLFEDVDLVRRLVKADGRASLVALQTKAITSPERYEQRWLHQTSVEEFYLYHALFSRHGAGKNCGQISMKSCSSSWSPKLIIFVKAPNKLAKPRPAWQTDIGAARAATFYRQATAKLLGRMADQRWETLLAVDPAPFICDGFTTLWPPRFPRIGQGQGDLGQRMGQQFTHAKPGPVIIIGSDAPGVTRALIAQGFAKLRGSDAVFGPADDGGYWLIGMARRRCAPNLFNQVRWSTEIYVTGYADQSTIQVSHLTLAKIVRY